MTQTLLDAFEDALEQELARFPLSELREVAESLSIGYRDRSKIRHTLSPIDRAAYLGVRFPSTFAVAGHVWDDVAQFIEPIEVETILDVGAGPGTASLAAARIFPQAQFSLFERDAGWREIATTLSRAAEMKARFIPGAIEQATQLGEHDVVVASYALNELPAAHLAAAVGQLWRCARKAMIVIEPGTPKGFEVVQNVRAQLLAVGAHAAAPCTHDLTCPMSPQDWCHRPVRVRRSAAHRFLKRAELGYEDEKFSYVVMTRAAPQRLGAGRVVRKPIRPKGHVHLDVCTSDGLRRVTSSKRQGAAYKAARDCDWGDVWSDHKSDE